MEKETEKDLYKLAREGKIKEFTGISDPYEVPKNPELILNLRIKMLSIVLFNYPKIEEFGLDFWIKNNF